jgi:hypothetical protein
MMDRGTTALRRLVRDPLRLATGNFLHDLGERYGGWSWVVTLTASASLPADRLLYAARGFARVLAVDLEDHYAAAFSLDYRGGQDGGHFHALLGGEAARRATKRRIEHTWRVSDAVARFSRVEKYNSGLSAELYLAKDAESWTGGIVCPRLGPCRHRSCTRGPSPF